MTGLVCGRPTHSLNKYPDRQREESTGLESANHAVSPLTIKNNYTARIKLLDQTGRTRYPAYTLAQKSIIMYLRVCDARSFEEIGRIYNKLFPNIIRKTSSIRYEFGCISERLNIKTATRGIRLIGFSVSYEHADIDEVFAALGEVPVGILRGMFSILTYTP